MLKYLVALFLIMGMSQEAQARRGVSGWSEEFTMIHDLPNKERFSFNGDYVDIGVKYKNHTIMFLPMWQDEFSYIAMIPGNDESYYSLTENEAQSMAQAAGYDLLPLDQVKLGLWTRWGGRAIVGACAVLIVLSKLGSRARPSQAAAARRSPTAPRAPAPQGQAPGQSGGTVQPRRPTSRRDS